MKLSTMLRLARVLLHVLQGMAICATVFPWLGQEQRNGQIRRWSRKLLLLCNVTVVQDGGALSGTPAPVLAQAMVVSNHVSWLDIFVIHSLYPSHFVAKATESLSVGAMGRMAVSTLNCTWGKTSTLSSASNGRLRKSELPQFVNCTA